VERIWRSIVQSKFVCFIFPLIIFSPQIRFFEAKDAFENCVQIIESNDMDKRYWQCVYSNLGNVYRRLKDYKNALLWFELALTFTFSEEQEQSCHTYIGITYHALKSYERAMDHYHRVRH
jgi:tetratricopeptide (TPR) repeat protein